MISSTPVTFGIAIGAGAELPEFAFSVVAAIAPVDVATPRVSETCAQAGWNVAQKNTSASTGAKAS
ncbi:hypothetical protein ASD86_13725 [Lysobacter sp. Root690]|nr:hypothetical protein ASD86_13725 [Lysobacter sp. Root690]